MAKAGLGVVASSSPSLPPPPAVEAPEYDEDPEEQEYEEQVPESLSIRNASMELIEKVLRKHDGNRKAAASELGISERTLYRKLKQMN